MLFVLRPVLGIAATLVDPHAFLASSCDLTDVDCLRVQIHLCIRACTSLIPQIERLSCLLEISSLLASMRVA